MFPLITVIVPVYNSEKYLSECVSSIIDQTYKNLEIILIDDGSKIPTKTLCDTLAQRDQRIVVYHKENGGASSARNYGLSKCRGEFITFVDSDDVISPNMVDVLFTVLSSECWITGIVGIVAVPSL